MKKIIIYLLLTVALPHNAHAAGVNLTAEATLSDAAWLACGLAIADCGQERAQFDKEQAATDELNLIQQIQKNQTGLRATLNKTVTTYRNLKNIVGPKPLMYYVSAAACSLAACSKLDIRLIDTARARGIYVRDEFRPIEVVFIENAQELERLKNLSMTESPQREMYEAMAIKFSAKMMNHKHN